MAWVLLCFFFLVVAFTTVLVSKFSDMCEPPALHTYIVVIRILHRCLFMMTLLIYSGRIILVQFVVAFM